jgi:monoamine oxidase
MAKSVPGAAPWRAKNAAMYDVQTIEQWSRGVAHLPESRALVDIAIRSVYGEEANQISLLDLLSSITGVGGDFNTLIGSAQSVRFVGGPQQMSKLLANHLGDRVLLRQPVTAIDRDGEFTVHTERAEIRARRVILAVPKVLLPTIDFRPQLPAIYRQLFQRQPMGATIKVNVVYATPFWRGRGLNGSVVADSEPIQVVYDNSPPHGRPGVLVGFLEGSYGRAHLHQTKAQRRRAVIDCLVRYFGAEARHATGYHELAWARERYTEGAYGSFSPPGVLTGLGPLLPDRLDGIVFAGADFSGSWPGYMDGAIGSGYAAAEATQNSLRGAH